ncbi:MAG: xanthine dehydrogenase family protein molybdopterin-binding subunit [Silicimonas sp.]|nr:xanthine dehydrogenase family protein molybdopterin-binding subunit [Silicimonas sp.]
MDKFGKSQPVRRLEDERFLRGAGRYVDDIAPENAIHAVFLRSQVAHGVLGALDLDEIRAMPGVLLVLGADDLGSDFGLGTTVLENRDGEMAPNPGRPVLARSKVRFVGEPITVIVAESRAAARDAADAFFPEIEELPAKIDMAPGGATIHEAAPDNEAFDWQKGDEAAVEAAIASAAHVVTTRVVDNRIICNSMEPRGCFAEWDGNRLHLAFGGQGVWGMKRDLAKCFGLDAEQVRVTNPDVGGGFGTKGMAYPEYFAVAAAAMKLGRPVRWMSDRTEAMLTDNGGRDLVSVSTLAFDADHKMTAYKVDTICNMGAYLSGYAQPIQTELFAKVASGVYDVQNVLLNCKGYYTTTTQIDAYRGAGRPEAIFVLERSMDNAARELGVDPYDLRRKSFIAPEKFPYKTAIADTYDVGEFDMVLSRAEAHADRAGFAARKAASEAEGKLRGEGLCYYIESILGDTTEHSRVVFEDDGNVSLFVGTQSNGQGHETVYAKFLADHSGIPVEAIRVVQGDSDLIPVGGGTGGSRSVTMQTGATLVTVDKITENFAAYLGEKFGTEGVSFDDEVFRIPGSNETPSMLDVAAMARGDDKSDILDVREKWVINNRSFPNGAHIAEVEIDPETGQVVIDRYVVTDDFGNLINPLLVEGQVHGGVAQGLGQALCEHVVYDEEGQLLTATFMDYGMPRASDLPDITFNTEPVPSLYNPMGMKGCGEAGTVGALAAIANAVTDAMASRGKGRVDMPFTPARVWAALQGEIAAE